MEKLITKIGKASAWLVVLLMLVVVWDVISRRFLTSGSVLLQELEWHLHGALFLLCMGYTYLENAHIRVELFSEKFKPRTKCLIEIAGICLFLIPYCGVLIYFGYLYAGLSFADMERSSAPDGLPYRWIIKSLIPIGIILLMMSGFVKLRKSFRALRHAEGADT